MTIMVHPKVRNFMAKVFRPRVNACVLVNRERVVWEMIELARLKISKIVGVTEDKVQAEVHVGDDGKVQARFSVDEEVLKTFPKEVVQATIAEEYNSARMRIYQRFVGLGDRRDSEEKEATTPSGT